MARTYTYGTLKRNGANMAKSSTKSFKPRPKGPAKQSRGRGLFAVRTAQGLRHDEEFNSKREAKAARDKLNATPGETKWFVTPGALHHKVCGHYGAV